MGRSLLWVGYCFAASSFAAERIDNVLVRLVPRDSVSLFGAQMEQVKGTLLYKKLVMEQKLPQLDQFARETNFDPRRDVRELLVASSLTKKSGVLLARGNFRISPESFLRAKDMRRAAYKGYLLWIMPGEDAGFCILDSTLAIAGPVESMKTALDQYRDASAPVSPLVQKAMAIPMRDQIWLISQGGPEFLSNNMPEAGPAANFALIFQNLEGAQLQADLSRGFNALIAGVCKTEGDAKSLADAARGLIGFGRLSVPDGQTQLLRVWDAIEVAQQGRKLTIQADIPPDLVERIAQLIDGGPKRPNDRSSSYSSEGESRPPGSRHRPH